MTNLDIKLTGLELLFEAQDEDEEIENISQHRNCVHSAVIIVTSRLEAQRSKLMESEEQESPRPSRGESIAPLSVAKQISPLPKGKEAHRLEPPTTY